MYLRVKLLNWCGWELARNAYVLLSLLGAAGMLIAVPSRAQIFNPTPIVVTTNADDFQTNGNCTLREAIYAANNNVAVDACASGSATLTDEITFDSSTDGKPIVLTLVGAGENNGLTGDLDILYNANNTNNEVYILGNGFGSTIIDGDQGDRVFDVLSNASLILEKLTVRRGAGVSNGAGIFAEQSSSLALNSVVVTNNIATAPTTARGGGIEADGTLYINNSFVIGNKAESTASGNALGGGLVLYSVGTKSINLSVVSNNTATSSSATGGLAQGGGIFQSASVNLSVTDSILANNLATTSTSAALGGAIDEDAGSLSLTRVQLTNNTASHTGTGGQSHGGAMSIRSGVSLINSTLAGNQADTGAGLYLYTNTGKATFHGATVARNDAAQQGGGVYVVGSAVLDLYGSILAGNTAGSSAPDCDDATGSGQINTDGYNLVGENDGCALNINGVNDQVGTATNPIDPKLGSLQLVSGAPTPTYVLPLLPGSPAIDAGDTQLTSAGGTCESPDQVGDTRPRDDNQDGTAACDIGAVEYVLTSTSPSSGGGSTSTGSTATSSGGGGGAMGLPILGWLLSLVVFGSLGRGKDRRKP